MADSKQQWSKDRPEKPDVDPLYLEIVQELENDPRSTFAKANVSGLSQSTLSNWMARKTKKPQSVSLQMAARMLGGSIKYVKG